MLLLPVVIYSIDFCLLATCLVFIQESFASLPDIQLLRCADYFGRAFSSVTTAQFGWNKILRETPIVKSLEVVYMLPAGVSV